MPTLDHFLAEYEIDDNAWQRLSPSEAQSLFDEAVERLQRLDDLFLAEETILPDGSLGVTADSLSLRIRSLEQENALLRGTVQSFLDGNDPTYSQLLDACRARNKQIGAEKEELRDRLTAYHKAIDDAFLAAGATPFRICKTVWRLHADMSRALATEEG